MDITVDRELREYTHLVGLQNQMVNTSHLQTPLCEGTPSAGRHFSQEHTFLGWTPPLRGEDSNTQKILQIVTICFSYHITLQIL